VWWGKVACWSTKAAISLKRVKIDEKLPWRALKNARSNGTIPDPVRPPLRSQDRGFGTPTKLQLLFSQERVKLRTDFKFDQYIHISHGPSEQKPVKNFGEKRERGRIQGLPKFFAYPLLSRERVKLQTSHFVCIFMDSIGTKAY